MIELTTYETFEIKGRGVAHVVAVPSGSDPTTWNGTEVLLNGEQVHIVGVELPARASNGQIWTCILVKDVEL